MMPSAVQRDLPAVLNRKIHIQFHRQIGVQYTTDRPVGTFMVLVGRRTLVGVAVALCHGRQTYRWTHTDTEMCTVIERLVHVAVGGKS